ncbi:hypothetical protein N7E02_01585 (plasmid) [Aliirhizobium terrae]|uniref:hypothetical protein n=1 Tax=Terrirhizobium terrae TaxID=2926709 RepID=UPI00257733F0|nr:hypothetical protein [Rhizobium sp. CC-CFT758]WJH38107.1 hypothetical protein N7E02_01585 [Rhizobium sp. CC-CFT758]
MNAQQYALNDGSSVEHWAMNRAHQIVVHQGMRLVEAAQSLDRKQTSANTYALRKAIMDCLIEAMQDGPVATAAE